MGDLVRKSMFTPSVPHYLPGRYVRYFPCAIVFLICSLLEVKVQI